MANELLFFILVGLSCAGMLGAARVGSAVLMSMVGLSVVLMNLVVLKQVRLFGCEATVADGLAIAAGLGLNLLREYGSGALARRAIWLSFAMAATTAAAGGLVVAFTPSTLDAGHVSIAAVFQPSLRILAASLISFVICERLEVRAFQFLRERWAGRHLAWRHMVSLCAAQALDTVLFSWLGLSGWVEPLWEIALVSFVIKMAAIAISGPFMALSKRVLRGPLHAAL